MLFLFFQQATSLILDEKDGDKTSPEKEYICNTCQASFNNMEDAVQHVQTCEQTNTMIPQNELHGMDET